MAKPPKKESREKEIENLKKELEEMTNLSRRALADLQNYKRRSGDEKAAFIKFANAALMQELLPSIENIYRALDYENKDAQWTAGVEQTLIQLVQTLEKVGLKAIETEGRMFDPNLHEALLTAPGEKDKILSELEKGYTFNGRVIKQAKVQVGNGEAK
jgi:molecular chaperone GrpE